MLLPGIRAIINWKTSPQHSGGFYCPVELTLLLSGKDEIEWEKREWPAGFILL